ncbi:MAG TPA: hypothetical protein VHZ33_23330 [Trebonia sp.]|jgi:hypothetical protein|nr:hypothetical protein [Trebonia sp.]
MTMLDVAARPVVVNRRIAPGKPRLTKVERRVGLAWYLLLLNALTFYNGMSVLHIPGPVGKLITQGSLLVAFCVALSANRKLLVRPNVFLTLVILLALGTIITCLVPQHFGTVYRTFRLVLYICTLWLLTPWWGRSDLLLVRFHLKGLSFVLITVFIGILVAPSYALGAGRLTGIIWPVPPPEVAHYSAMVFGMVAVLWMCGQVRGKPAACVCGFAAVLLLLTHTRTALLGLVVALIVAGLSLIVARPRVRRLFTVTGTIAAVTLLTLSSVVTSWLSRGQNSGQLTELTGRTVVWGQLLGAPRTKFQEIFGFGLSNNSFNGLPIDSNWLASYQSQGLFGVTMCALLLLFLLVTSFFQERGVERALALFLTSYCLVASFTEVGFTDVSPYLLEITLAASLIVSTRQSKGQE